jgi:multidrug resistance efflux pump
MNKLCCLTIVLLAVACSTEAEKPEVKPAAVKAPAPTNRIEIPASIRSNLGITFAKVELRRVAATIRVPGAFELLPQGRHEYRMALPGRVELLVNQYDEVTPGQVLYRFQSPAWPELLHEIIVGEQAMDTAIAETKVGDAKVLEAGRKLELLHARLEELAKADFKNAELEAQAAEIEVSLPRLQAEADLSKTHLKNAKRTRQHALHRAATAAGLSEADLEKEVLVGEERVSAYTTIDWIEVSAVQSGIVATVDVTNGSFLESPSQVISTVDPLLVRFRALALQGDLPMLAGASEARIVPPRSPGLALDDSVAASITMGLEAHPFERTATVLAVPQRTAEWIHPGVSAFLEIVVDSSAGQSLAVPRSAIVQDGLTHIFFRRDPAKPNEVIRVEADMGVSDGRWVALESGVMRGDEIVLTGAYELKLAMQRSGAVQVGGHVHADGTFHAEGE